MKKLFTNLRGLSVLMFLLLGLSATAQMSESKMSMPASDKPADDDFKPHGQLWGYAFGDFAYKGATDEAGRGGSNQYTKIPLNTNLFQFRRVYLGYDYEISKKFVAEFLLAAEDDFASGVLGQGNGDILVNNKFTPYLKLANLRWRNIWKGTDLVIGQSPTPAFAQGSALAAFAGGSTIARNTQTSEEVWAYRSIERTVSDIRRTPSYDFGASLQGWFDEKGNYGYDLMVGNGQSDKPENDPYKWFYGDVYAKFFNKRLIVQFYQDYEKLNWSTVVNGNPEIATTPAGGKTTYALPAAGGFHHDRNMSKLFVAWNDKKFTVGVEAFTATFMGDVQAVGTDHKVYYLTSKATAISAFVRGAIYKDKLGFFARYDNYNPSGNLSAITNNSSFISYSALTANYEPTNKEQFVTFGIDYTPIKKVHIMPNIWMNTYNTSTTLSSSQYSLNSSASGVKNSSDLAYRITFYYIYGK